MRRESLCRRGRIGVFPVYLDLLFVAKDSARLGDVSDSFFLGVPPCATGKGQFSDNLFDWSWLGNAIDPKYPCIQWLSLPF
jgi:hypothetical protein